MNKYTVLSFITTNTPYQEILEDYLLPTLITFNLPHHIEYVENKGSWLKNTALKPEIILNALEFFNTDIVFIDADAKINSYPILFDELDNKYDLAVHYLDWQTWYGHVEPRKELLTGTMYLRNNEKVKKLVRDWKEKCFNNSNWEQRVLEGLVWVNKEINVLPLPIEYCYINSLPKGQKPLVKIEHPIITHYQASRTLKRMIK